MSVDGWSATVLKSIADGVIATDADARVVFMNRAAEELTGWEEADARGTPISEVLQLIDERTGKREVWPVREALASGQPVTLPPTTILRSRSGHQLSIDDVASPVRDESGTVTGVVIVFRDVTEKRQYDEAIQAREKRFRALVKASSDVIYRMSADWAEMQPLDGRGLVESNEEPIRDWLQNNLPEFEHARVREAIHEAVSRKQTFEFEHQVIGPEGTLRWTFSRAIPILDADGHIIEWLGTATDITERKEAEKSLRLSEERLRLAAVAAGFGFYDSDLVTGKVFWSQEMRRLLGIELDGTTVSAGEVPDFVHPEDRERVHSQIQDSFDPRGSGTFEDEHRIVRPDGSVRWVLLKGSTLFLGEGDQRHPIRAAGVLLDITERKRAEAERERLVEQLKDTDRRKDEFLAMLAHELRNPLAAVSNAVTVLKMSNAPENVDFAKDVIERQSRQLARLIEDLLDVSRITSGKIRLKRELCDAGVILKNAVECVQPLVKERKHRLETDFVEGSLPVRVDPIRVEQVFVNLLTNAAKYTESGGRIRVRGDRENDSIIVAIEDNGVGIPPEKLPQMFELFAQGERSIARSEGGLGIGLTIVQKLTEMHGGSVTAESRGVGKGSTFTVRLPAAARAPLPSGKAQPDAAGERRGYRILVVDDNEDTARSMARFLKLLGHEVEAAYDGHAAIEVARKTAPEIILLDIGLPGMDGYEVARRLREVPCCKAAVIVAVSGYGQDDDRRRSREAGFDHHLVKPIEFDSLIQLISQSC